MSSIDGLITGIDTTTVVEGLLQLQKSQVDRLEARKQDVVTKQTAFAGLEARLLGFRGALSGLSKSNDGVFDRFTATTSDEEIVQATASSKAQPGSYRLRVTQLASAEQIASQSFDDVDSEITTGDFTIQLGNRNATTITIDSENNTVQGLANSINAATNDVQASVLNEGGSVRLLISSNHTGEDNQINITNNLGAASGDAVLPDFSGPVVQAAADATITFGSGAGAINISSATNQVEDVIDGVTLNLTSVDTENEVTVTVANDTEGAKSAITNFVSSYNQLMSYIDDQTDYNQETDKAGVLLGNATVRDVQNDVRALVSNSVGDTDDPLRTLSSIGLQFTATGQLTINENKLDKVLNGEENGIDIQDVKKLFALTGDSSTQKIEFLQGSSETVSEAGNFEVNITQAASRASVLGANTIASSIVIDSSNQNFEFTIDGLESGELTLLEGTYTQAEFAQLVEDTINNNPATSATVSIAVESNQLRLTSDSFGEDSEISGFSGTAIATLGFDGTETDNGTDVEGHFVVNGEIESATGSGRILTADSDNENTSGIQLRVLLTDADVTAGGQSDLSVSRGYAGRLDQILDGLLDSDNGRLKFANEGFEQTIDSIQSSIDLVNEISEAKQAYLVQQFTALETSIASLQNTGSILASQLGGITQN